MPGDPGLDVPEYDNTEYERVEIIEGLEGYKRADINNVIDGSIPEYSYSDGITDSITVIKSMMELSPSNFIEALGLTWSDINGETVHPRSAAASLSFELRDEGFEFVSDSNGTSSAVIEYLDLIAHGDTIKLLRFIFDKIDPSQWAHTTTINGDAGLSTFLSISGSSESSPKIEAGLFVELSASRLGLRKVPVIDAFIPNAGIADLNLIFSFASSHLAVRSPANPNIGYPDLSVESVVQRYYAPFSVDFKIRPISDVDISRVYSLIYDMLITNSDVEAIYNYELIRKEIWPEHSEDNIVLDISMVFSDGSVNTETYKDYDLIDLIRKAMGAF